MSYFLIAIFKFSVCDNNGYLTSLFEVLEIELEFQKLNRFLRRVIYFADQIIQK